MKTVRSCSACLFIFAVLMSAVCAAKPAGDGMFDRLRSAASSVPGWTEHKEKYQVFTVKELYDIIDGGAMDYEKQGLKNGILVTLKNGDKVLEFYFDDFDNSAGAKGMVEIKKKSLSAPKILPKVDISPAFYDEVLGGCVACWAKGNYYIEMTLTGYDAPEKSVADAAALINAISPVIGK
jgi:hypothetical protein